MSGPPDFEAMYRADPDPWRVGTSHYERRKRAVVMACLQRETYELAWDPASGTGHLAADLATRCRSVLAADASPRAVELTRERCAGLPVTVSLRALPAAPDPPGSPRSVRDLIVLSEVFYYLGDEARAATIDLVDTRGSTDCEVVCVHWDGAPADAWLSGPGAQRELVSRLTALGWRRSVHHVDDGFVLDSLGRSAS